ncbi:DUF4350 domain-containing protein [Pseudoalteromonas sp. T1lg65]|uniref:DUF4350 domain-containing protein n=1 Tax=Pseudoalteromonas sp. T1lg65 TaxID=2077101 RepID=UPI003F7AF781
MKSSFKMCLFGLVLVGLLACSDSSQDADPTFIPKNTLKSFSKENSPVVLVDEAHHNFLTASGRYKPFSQVLKSDGYTVRSTTSYLTLEHLKNADILVIANALDKNRSDWNPPFTNAFNDEEVSNIKKWLHQGGSLFLVADHTPFPKVIENLTSELGFVFSNGHVGHAMFHTDNNTLGAHEITLRESKPTSSYYAPTSLVSMTENQSQFLGITQVRSFGGSAFKPPKEATSLLTLGQSAVSILPEVPFEVTADTPRVSVASWSQGAVMRLGKGRVAVFAEGMMFSSQLDTKTGNKIGLVSAGAEQNERFLLNVMAWLAHAI